ncbi:MAG: GTP-binding protein [Candidatus Hodarchaeales archaeon]
MSHYNFTFKVLVIGEDTTIKTAFINRNFHNYFNPRERPSIGVDFYVKTFEINGSKIKFQIWDLEDQARIEFLLKAYFIGADGVFALYDITSQSSLDYLSRCIQIIREKVGYIPIMIIGDKLDLNKNRAVSIEDGKLMAKNYNLASFCEISSKENVNVNECWNAMAQILIERHSRYLRENPQPPEVLKFKNSKAVKFKVNDHLTLRLENDKTNIYVDGKLFKTCKRLLLDVPIDSNEDPIEIESMDEAVRKLDSSVKTGTRYRYNITPLTEFWGHCSNLQSWYENKYDTRMLQRYLAFPLLKALMKAGDPIAKKVFKEEIVLRLENGYPSTVWYLIFEGYLNYFSKDELDSILESPKFLKNLEKWYMENCMPKWLTKKIVAKLKNYKCPNCDSKPLYSSIKRALNGKPFKCEFCYSDVLKDL